MKYTLKTAIRVACVCVAFSVASSGCIFNSREVTVSDVCSLHSQREYYRNELFNHDGLTLESENFLRGNLLRGELRRNPVLILKKLDEYFRVSGNPKYLLIASDLCRYLATRADEEDAIQYHLSNFHYCTAFLRFCRQNDKCAKSDSVKEDTFDYDLTASQGIKNYNEACNGIFSYLHKRKILDATSITLLDREGRRFVLGEPRFCLSVPREAIEDFSLCAAHKVNNLMLINREPGIGVPLVATVKEKQWYSSLKTPKGLTIPVTLAIDSTTDASGDTSLRLSFIDTYRQEVFTQTMTDNTRIKVNLALDFSAPLACFLNDMTQRNLLTQMLNPLEQEAGDGLYMIEPYQPNKIPVVFIHGLMSSPETWMQMINALKNDPTVRSRYQFWFFSYSTGAPVFLSSHKLRTALLAAEKEFCTTPEATANFNKMVLVGHSMGGILTRLMVQKDPYFLMEQVYNMSREQIKAKLQPEDFQLLSSFIPHPLSFVHRAVFMAVPHKGANLAQSFIGKLGSYLITLPKSFLNNETAITRINETLVPGYSDIKTKLKNRFFTGIDNLDPDNPFVLANGKSPLKDDLSYHCIIGNIDRAGAPDGSDGVVPYWSSHLDNAASELIVESDHSVHRRPAAMQELLRILLLHLKSVEAS